jgi:hypothetical protein
MNNFIYLLYMIQLPEDLLIYIASILDYKDLIIYSKLNRYLNNFVKKNEILLWNMILANSKNIKLLQFENNTNLRYENHVFSYSNKKIFKNNKEAFIKFREILKNKKINI